MKNPMEMTTDELAREILRYALCVEGKIIPLEGKRAHWTAQNIANMNALAGVYKDKATEAGQPKWWLE